MMLVQRLLNSERGMILFTTLLILSLLLAVGLGSMVSARNDFLITQNLRGLTSALYLADAGIEWGKEQIGAVTGNPPALADSTRNFSAGAFAVAYLSSTQTSPLSARIIFRSTGILGSSSQTIQTQVSKNYDLADGAVGLRGNSRSINFAGSSFYISGVDYDPISNATISGAKPRAGITVSSATLLGLVENGLNNGQKDQILGSDNNGAAISLSDRMPGDMLTRLANDICSAPAAQISAVPPSGNLSLTNQIWGSRAAPQLHCINGLSESGDSVMAGENFSGAGILVVKDAPLIASGTFHWEGLIVVTGNDIGFQTMGEGSKEVIGALMVNETGAAVGGGVAILDIQGAIRIFYSRPALGIASSLIRSVTLANNYEWLPFYLKQEYWRSLNP